MEKLRKSRVYNVLSKLLPTQKKYRYQIILGIVIWIVYALAYGIMHRVIGIYKTSIITNIVSYRDTGYYLGIAEFGYPIITDFVHSSVYSFFPLYPIQLALLGAIVTPYYSAFASVVVNSIVLFSLITLLIHINSSIYKDLESHLSRVYYYCGVLLWPTSFFYFIAYSEALISILLTSIIILTITLSRVVKTNRDIGIMSVLTLLLILVCSLIVLSKSVGIVLICFVPIYFFVDHTFWSLKKFKQNLVPLCIVFVVLVSSITTLFGLFKAYESKTGNFWIARDSQVLFGRTQISNSSTLTAINDRLKLASSPLLCSISQGSTNFSNALCLAQIAKISLEPYSLVVFVLLVLISFFVLPKDSLVITSTLVSLMYTVFPLMSGSFGSIHRYVLTTPATLVLFPLVFVKSEWHYKVAFGLFFGIFATFYMFLKGQGMVID